MNTTSTRTLTTVNLMLLVLLSAPVVSHANTQKSVTIGDTVLSNEHIPAAISNLDYTIKYMNQAGQEIGTNKLHIARSDIHKAQTELSQLQEFDQGIMTENITVTHGAKMNQMGFTDTSNAYYSPDMQDMRLLRMAETSLKHGDSDAALRHLSAVRFPYVTANVQLSTDDSMAIAERVNRDLQNDDTYDAAFDAQEFNVDAHAYASLFDEAGNY